ncbi:protein FAR1-RELATED SEQUENCE 5-like [Magnolia sinica]|uniref:protein FAR1-RELATED SEQUENCE 5-like n=1 Tax=Magnolia sinica TaxID=86752 RepID=UPI00265858B1|nr:protein FAR1-RELATED SEQUENCE 5-like [Magnolia sinica]
MDFNTLESLPSSQPSRRLDFDIEMDDQGASQQLDNQGARKDLWKDTYENLDEEPKVGMEFASDESAFEFYNKYARIAGFSARKGWVHKSDDGMVILTRIFCCSKEGQRRENKQIVQRKFNRPITRTQCLANMKIKLQKNGKYIVTKFVAEHNHEVIPPAKVHMLRSHRGKTKVKKAKEDIVDDLEVTPKATVELLSKQSGGQENPSFVPNDYKNDLRKRRMKAMEKGDAGAVLEYFQKMQVDNPSFFYAIQVDEDDRITNMFWTDAKARMDYSVFGDVVSFDTTYKINSYGRPFAPFIGVNHHKQSIVFGAAFLYDETIESFKWLFQTFLSAMSGKQPITILTDQDTAMVNALASVMPETYHRLCLWHVYQNAAKHLNHVFKGSKSFQYDFSRCIYDYEEEQEFVNAWNGMLEKYDLMENRWLQDLFKEREKWALVYSNTFCADMKSTQRSGSLGNALKKYLNSKYNLLHFFTHYERVLADRRYQESISDFKMRQSTPVMFLDVKMLNEAAKVYTPEVFALFQEEYKKFISHSIYKCGEFGTVIEYRVIFNDKNEARTVKFDALDNTVSCSCKKFEFAGILCSHALKVLDCYNIKALQPRYILKRWQRDAKIGFGRDQIGLPIEGERNVTSAKRYKYLCRKLHKLAAIAGEHDDLFKFADRYADNFHDELMERMKGLKEPPLMSFEAIDESVDTERARLEPTESIDVECACSEPTESVHTDGARSEQAESIDRESARHEPNEKQVTVVETQNSQTASGIKAKPGVGGSRRAYKNPLGKVRKKNSQSESIQPQANQERQETAQASNITHPTSFQPSHYPCTFPTFNQGSHVTVVSPLEISSGSHEEHGHRMVMGYTPSRSGSINAQLTQYEYQVPNTSMFQQNIFNIGAQVENSVVARPNHFEIPRSGTSDPSNNPQLSHLRQQSSTGSVAFSQSSSPLPNINQSLGCEDHNLRLNN